MRVKIGVWVDEPLDVYDVYFDGGKFVSRDGCAIHDHCIDEIKWDDEETIQERMSDNFKDYVGDVLDSLDEIRVEISDKLSPHNYFNVRNDDWQMRVVDSYVDDAYLDERYDIDENIKPTDYLDAEIQHLAGICEDRNNEEDYWNTVAKLIREYDFDGALEMLQ